MKDKNNTEAHKFAHTLKAEDIEREYAQGFGQLENFYLNDPRSLEDRCKAFMKKLKRGDKKQAKRYG